MEVELNCIETLVVVHVNLGVSHFYLILVEGEMKRHPNFIISGPSVGKARPSRLLLSG